MAGKYLSRDAIIHTIKGAQRMNAIRRRQGLTKHPVRTVSCGCSDPGCGAFHAIVPERIIPSPEECAALLAFEKLWRPARTEQMPESSTTANSAVGKSVALWATDSQGLVFTREAPPAEATACAVGVLVLLTRTRKSWRIADSLRFTVAGRYADVSAKLATEPEPGLEVAASKSPVVTITERHTRARSVSTSYTVLDSRLKLLSPE